jgi:hypothetical protein
MAGTTRAPSACARFTARCGARTVIGSTRRWPSAAPRWYTRVVDASVEVRYAGVVVGRGPLVRELDEDGGFVTAFVSLAEPMPVGTAVTLTIGEDVRSAIVEEVVESAEPAAVGMRVRWGAGSPSRTSSIPTVVAPTSFAASAPAADFVAASPGAAPLSVAPTEDSAAEAVVTGEASSGDTSPDASREAPSDAVGGPIPAPLSLAGPSGEASHPGGGGKRRRKRR